MMGRGAGERDEERDRGTGRQGESGICGGGCAYAWSVRPADDSLLVTDLAGLSLRNPVILAAGTCGYLDEMADMLDLSRVGGLVTKSITARAREGNPTWRVVEGRGGVGM